jgi:hypothetical protein
MNMAAPPGLAGAQLAEWLVDNTALTFAQIARQSGLVLEHVQAIADGETYTTAVELPMTTTKAAARRMAYKPGGVLHGTRADRIIVDDLEPDCSDIPEATAEQFATAVRMPARVSKVVDLGTPRAGPGKPIRGTVDAPSTPPLTEREQRIVRFAGWFLAARWRYESTAQLFNLQAEDLRALMDGKSLNLQEGNQCRLTQPRGPGSRLTN